MTTTFNYTSILFCLFLISCQPGKVETLISDYEQTEGNTKTDLNLKIIKLKRCETINFADSIVWYQNWLDSIKWEIASKGIRDTASNEYFTQALKRTVQTMSRYKSAFNEKKVEQAKVYLRLAEKYTNAINRLKGKPAEEMVGVKYDCTYSINNPFFGGVKQTINKSYIISQDESKILETSNQE